MLYGIWPDDRVLELAARLFPESPKDMTLTAVLRDSKNPAHLQLLFSNIDKVVDLKAREGLPMSKTNIHGNQAISVFQYAMIVARLGRLGTREAVDHIIQAFTDYDPMIRAAASKASGDLDRSRIDPEIMSKIEKLLRERLLDTPDYVAEAAAASFEKLGLKISKSEKERILKECLKPSDSLKKHLDAITGK
jgi:hypothetical protein